MYLLPDMARILFSCILDVNHIFITELCFDILPPLPKFHIY